MDSHRFIGGTLAAPIAARLIGRLRARQLGIFIAAAITLLNGIRIIMNCRPVVLVLDL